MEITEDGLQQQGKLINTIKKVGWQPQGLSFQEQSEVRPNTRQNMKSPESVL